MNDFVVLKIKPKVLYMLNKYSVTGGKLLKTWILSNSLCRKFKGLGDGSVHKMPLQNLEVLSSDAESPRKKPDVVAHPHNCRDRVAETDRSQGLPVSSVQPEQYTSG